jgi:hypothetical protein
MSNPDPIPSADIAFDIYTRSHPHEDMRMREPTSYYVRAIWDEEASVYYSETNIPGLNVEADTICEFIDIAQELAPAMLMANVPDYAESPHPAHPKAELELKYA